MLLDADRAGSIIELSHLSQEFVSLEQEEESLSAQLESAISNAQACFKQAEEMSAVIEKTQVLDLPNANAELLMPPPYQPELSHLPPSQLKICQTCASAYKEQRNANCKVVHVHDLSKIPERVL